MRKIFFASVVYLLCSCGNAENKTGSADTKDTAGNSNPVSSDTTKQPSGVDNSSAISTDTAAINVQNTIEKADSLKNKQ